MRRRSHEMFLIITLVSQHNGPILISNGEGVAVRMKRNGRHKRHSECASLGALIQGA